MKLAVIIMSDPKTGEEALGRAFNGLATAAEGVAAGDEVEIVFQGTGVRWPEVLTKVDHPANELYNAVRANVTGVSRGCAAVFGATEAVQALGLKELADFELSGTPGLASLRRYAAEGWTPMVF